MPRTFTLRVIVTGLCLIVLTGCGTREVQDSLTGATAQRLVAHSIDQLVERLPEADFRPHAGKRVHLTSHFLHDVELRRYADRRLAVTLQRRYGMTVVDDPALADIRLEVFYTALGTDHSRTGFVLPLGFVPGLEQSTRIDLITLEKFHGVAEMYYFVGPGGSERRGELIQARTRSDALGLPVITIPLSDIEREDAGGD